MSRTRELVERDLAHASKQVQQYESKLGSKTDKKSQRHDPIWRRLQSEVAKFKNQLNFIAKRQKKADAGE